MFRRDLLLILDREKRLLESFDRHLAARLNEKRLIGQITFEYGTLLNWTPSWLRLSVLDVGTGNSTLPNWMAAQGAAVVCFEYPHPIEKVSSRVHRARSALSGRNGYRPKPRWVYGDMLKLPFSTGVFDLVTSFSVIEHLDTEMRTLTYVPYREQKERAAQVLSEMIRVAKPGGHIYVTSDCCDYTKATTDAWRVHYYFAGGGGELSSAWPADEVMEIFYDYLPKHGCSLVGPSLFAPSAVADERFQTFRGPFFSVFAVLAKKNEQSSVDT